MARHTRRNIAFVVFGVIIVGSMVFLFLQGAEGGEVNVTLPPPNALLTSTDLIGFTPITQPIGAIPIGEIECKIKQTTQVFDAGNKIIDFEESSGVAGTPVFTLQLTTVPSQFPINYFNIALKAFCVQQNNVPISVVAETIKVKALGTFLNERNVLLFEKAQSSSKVARFGSGQGEQVLTNVVMPKLFIEDGLPLADFPITIEFDVTGNIEVFYDNFPNFRYNIPLFQDNINSFITVNVERAIPILDSDGDGVLDEFDLCPNEQETFNNFQDNDGCFDISPEPPEPPIPPPPPNTCDDTKDPIICKIECVSQGGIYQQLEGVPVCIKTPECAVGEKLELQTGNIFVCVPDPDQLDNDGDGILNGIDACPNLFGVAEFNGCPSGTTTIVCPDGITIVTSLSQCPSVVEDPLQEKIIKGDIVTLTTVRFTDKTFESVTASARGGGLQLPNLSQQISNLIPAQLFGTLLVGEGKAIDEITIEVFYFNNESQLFIVESKDISLILTVEESSVSSATSNPIPLLGSIGTGDLRPQTDEVVSPFGTGISLGRVTIISENIIDLGEQAGITSGQREDANLIFSISGFVNFRDIDETERFLLTNTLITIRNVDIDNVAPPVAEPKCLDSQIEIIDPRTGRVIGCETPPPTAPKCFSSERPQGYACTPQDILTFCDGDPTNCREKDLDNDGVPDHRDDCRDVTKNNLKEDGLTINGSDPDDGCKALSRGIEPCNPLVRICPPIDGDGNGDGDGDGDGGKFCSETNPDNCIIPPEQLILFVIAGAVIAIVIGVALAIRSRRPTVFGG